MDTDGPAIRCGEVVRIRDERWRIVGHVSYGASAIVDAAGCGAANRAVRAKFLLPCEPIERLAPLCAPRVVTPPRWRHAARRAVADARPSWTSLRAAAAANIDVLAFQLEPALALTHGAGCRFLIADAVGLGKTIQAALMIAEVQARRSDARALVIAPAGLRDQWKEELRSRFDLDPTLLDGPSLARLAAELPADVNPWAVQPLVLTSIDYVKRPEIVRALEALTWDIVVFDEAHNLAGRSDRAAAAALIAERARVLVLLTATPHSGDEAAFARLCGLGDPAGTEPLILYRRTRADASIAGARRAPIIRVRPTAAERAMHKALMAYARLVWREAAGGARLVAAVLARRACSSAGSLARSVERRLTLLQDGSPREYVQADLPYDAAASDDEEPDGLMALPGLRDPADERGRLTELLRLARAAARAESKPAALVRLLSRTNEPAIVFTEYRDTLQRLASALAPARIAELHGGLSARERADALSRFASGDARILLATDAGSEGLNLHRRCRLVIHLELPWTPLRLEQRIGRVDRIGQTRRVHAVHFVAAHTCEETTLAQLARRVHRSHETLGLFSRLPDEQQVAESVLGRQPLPEAEPGSPAAATVVATLDLRVHAQEEASWIRQARGLAPRPKAIDLAVRPAVTRIRRRTRRIATPQCVWMFKLTLTGGGDIAWESLLPLTAEAPGLRGCSGTTLREVLNPNHPALTRVVRGAQHQWVEAFHNSLGEPLRRWSARERAIVQTIQARHARLSAGLIQRGLFDRRRERLADAQAALLEEALAASGRRLADLAACERVRVDTCELVCAVVLE